MLRSYVPKNHSWICIWSILFNLHTLIFDEKSDSAIKIMLGGKILNWNWLPRPDKINTIFLWILKLCLVKEKIKDKLTVFLSSISKIENSNNKNMWCSEWAKGLILLQTKMLRFVLETNIF